MTDKDEADDKIIAALKSDAIFGAGRDITEVPPAVIARLKHDFLTYKRGPDDPAGACEIHEVYGADTTRRVIEASKAGLPGALPGHSQPAQRRTAQLSTSPHRPA